MINSKYYDQLQALKSIRTRKPKKPATAGTPNLVSTFNVPNRNKFSSMRKIYDKFHHLSFSLICPFVPHPLQFRAMDCQVEFAITRWLDAVLIDITSF